MKRKNGENIITSEDITILGKNLRKKYGDNLENVLEKLSETQDSLKSNVKWLYKYGGVGGSGGGGGNGSSSPWSVSCTLGGNPISEGITNNLSLPTKGKYTLSVKINYPSGGSFILEYLYNSRTIRTTLDLSVRWTYLEELNLDKNGSLTIKIIDGNDNEKVLSADYVVEAYKLTTNIVHRNRISYVPVINNSYNFGISNVLEEGLYLSIKYNNIVDNTQVKVEYNTLSGQLHSLEYNLDKVNNKELLEESGELCVNLIDVENFGNDNAGSYLIEAKIYVNGLEYSSNSYNCSFIPNTVYLQVFPIEGSSGTIYKTDNIENPKEYYIGNISFNVTPYNGNSNTGQLCTVSSRIYYKNNENQWEDISNENNSLSILERESRRYTINVIQEGLIKVDFLLSIGTSTNNHFIYYLVTKDIESTVDWFRKDHSPNIRAAYRYNIVEDPEIVPFYEKNLLTELFTLLSQLSILEQSYGSNEREFNFDINNNKFDISANYNFMFLVGILFNDVNDDNVEILRFVDIDNISYISIKLNSIKFGENTIGTSNSFFIEKETNYDILEKGNYHLITVCRRFLETINQNKRYEYSVYIDGILQGILLSNLDTNFPKIRLLKANYAINLLEMDYFSIASNNIEDIDVVNYWYSYQEKVKLILINNDDIELTTLLSKLEHSYYNNGQVTVEGGWDSLSGICSKSKVPCLLLKYEYLTVDFFTWSDTPYQQEETPLTINVSLAWSKGDGSPLENINTSFTSFDNALCLFSLKIQGSSTKGYKSKNYDLIANSNTDGVKFLYTPRFYSEDVENSFLPENTFTLKADVVDSSHTNNTCVGKFVNNNTTHFNIPTIRNNKYSKYVRNCLEGFPVLLFLEYTKNGRTDYYYLGIYNFNLGRSSNFNLGYYNLDLLDTIIGNEGLNDGLFSVIPYRTNSVTLQSFRDLIIAEVQENESLFDFSNYSDSLLFPIDKNDVAMFGDIIQGEQGIAQPAIKTFVLNSSKAGGYIFKKLGKTFKSLGDTSGYKLNPGEVPNPVIQYKRKFEDQKFIFYLDEEITQLLIDLALQELNAQSVYNYVLPHENISDNSIIDPSFVDYNSLIEYYTICMTFCLLDSVLKNLNIKSWDRGKTFYLAFYDMDTCLGIDNKGNNSTYFAFSDYWELTNPEEDEDNSTEDDPVFKLKPATIYRDYCPSQLELSEKGITDAKMFDTPSNYLFAVAKYAKLVLLKVLNEEDTLSVTLLNTPTDLWAILRGNSNDSIPNVGVTSGALKDAKTFMNNYFNAHMQNVNEMMFNMDFRNKYLFYNNSNDKSLHADSEMFHGYRRAYIEDWLRKRLHILDAYFNLTGALSSIMEGNVSLNEQIYEPLPDTTRFSFSYSNNEDVSVSKDIFVSGSGVSGRTYNALDFIVSAPDFSPLIIKSGGASTLRYLLLKLTEKYRITTNIEASGTNYMLGGSTNWNYLKSINSAANGETLYMNSSKLSKVEGNAGTINNWELHLKALKEIVLNSGNYSGDLTFRVVDGGTDYFPNLNLINISGSKIGLVVDGEKVQEIKALNLRGSDYLKIYNCNYLNTLLLSGSIKELVISNWKDNFIYLGSTHIGKIQLNTDIVLNKFTYTGDSEVSLINLGNAGFKEITIENCSNLSSADFGGTGITDVTVRNCSNLISLSISADNLESLTLTNCNKLSNLTLVINEDKNLTKLTKFYIDKTKISKCIIKENGSSGSLNLLEYFEDTILDLRKLSNLQDFNCFENGEIQYIHFNTSNKKCSVQSFKNCERLKRIFGTFKTTNNTSFENCHLFTLQGSNLDTWKGASKKEDGKTLTPFEIINKNKLILDFDNNDFSFTEKDFLLTVDFTTNMLIGSTSNNNCFKLTSATVFDVYYFLNSLAISKRGENDTFRIYSTFSNSGEYLSNTNPPNLYMFHGCHSISYIYDLISCNSNSVFTLKSPDGNENEILKDNGIFSPLKNIETIYYIFSSASLIFDRNILRRKSGRYNKLKTFIYNYISKILPLLEGEDEGDMTNFFKDIPNITTLTYTFNFNQIKYSTLHIPSTISSITGCFNNSYAVIGENEEFNLNSIFNESSYPNLKTLANSFTLTYSNNNIKTEFIISNNMFSKMPNLEDIGYCDTTNNVGGYITKLKDSNEEKTFSFGFHGNGFNKTFEGNTFTDRITYGLNNLKNFVGLFSETSGVDITFPGDMFYNNTKLENIASLFQNSTCNITLTEEGFKYCNKLKNVNRLFYSSVFKNNNTYLSGTIQGHIPFRFFYTGETVTEANYYVIDNDTYEAYFGENPVSQDFNYNTYLKKITYTKYNTPLSSMVECFFGLDSIAPYKINPNHYTINNGLYEYDNSLLKVLNRVPVPDGYNGTDIYYYKVEDISSNWKQKSGNDLMYDMSLIYDGNTEHLNSSYYCEDTITNITAPEGVSSSKKNFTTENYFCPPDLFAYCNDSSEINIRGVFRQCGLHIESSWSPKQDTSSENGIVKGIYGRICPYLFKSLTKLTHIYEFFEWCKGLREILYTLDGNTVAELIPSNIFKYNKNLTGLSKTFSGMYFMGNLSNSFLNPIKNNTLDVRGIFSNCYFDGIYSIDNFFSGLTIYLSSAWGAFNRSYLILSGNNQCSYYREDEKYSYLSSHFSITHFNNNFGTNSFNCFSKISSAQQKTNTVSDIYKCTGVSRSNITEDTWGLIEIISNTDE